MGIQKPLVYPEGAFFYPALQYKEYNLILRIPPHFVAALQVSDIGRLDYFQKRTLETYEIM